jgi:hypothetical protein
MGMAKKRLKQPERAITVIDRKRPRVAVQLTEIVYDQKSRGLKRTGRSHLTVYGLSGEQAKAIVANAFRAIGKS